MQGVQKLALIAAAPVDGNGAASRCSDQKRYAGTQPVRVLVLYLQHLLLGTASGNLDDGAVVLGEYVPDIAAIGFLCLQTAA